MHFIIKICILKEYVTFEVLPKCVLRSSISFSHSVEVTGSIQWVH